MCVSMCACVLYVGIVVVTIKDVCRCVKTRKHCTYEKKSTYLLLADHAHHRNLCRFRVANELADALPSLHLCPKPQGVESGSELCCIGLHLCNYGQQRHLHRCQPQGKGACVGFV